MSSTNGCTPIPSYWTDSDKRAFLKIAIRRKEEHVSGYTVVALGTQLYFHISVAERVHSKENGVLTRVDTCSAQHESDQ